MFYIRLCSQDKINNMIQKLKRIFFETLINLPIGGRYITFWYSKLGVNIDKDCTIDRKVKVIADYKNITLGNKVEIRWGSVMIAYDKISIGDNTAIAYQTLILTSPVPGGKHNSLFNIYQRTKKPVKIGHDCWIGARSTIFPGVTIGNYCVVAAGSVVTKDVPDFSVVAGVPAKVVKKIDPSNILTE